MPCKLFKRKTVFKPSEQEEKKNMTLVTWYLLLNRRKEATNTAAVKRQMIGHGEWPIEKEPETKMSGNRREQKAGVTKQHLLSTMYNSFSATCSLYLRKMLISVQKTFRRRRKKVHYLKAFYILTTMQKITMHRYRDYNYV